MSKQVFLASTVDPRLEFRAKFVLACRARKCAPANTSRRYGGCDGPRLQTKESLGTQDSLIHNAFVWMRLQGFLDVPKTKFTAMLNIIDASA